MTLARRSAVVLLALLLGAMPSRADVVDDAQDADAQQDYDEAARLWAEVLVAEPERRDAALGLARAVTAAKRWDLFPAAEKALARHRVEDATDVELEMATARLFLGRAPHAAQALYRAALHQRARSHFEAVLDEEPGLAEAICGLAEARMGTNDLEGALGVLDAWLDTKPEGAGHALFLKGRMLYDQAQAEHKAAGGGYPLNGDVQRLYGRAQGALLGSAAAAPRAFDTWMHIAWSSQVLGDRETANMAYERAYALDPESPLPLRGLAVLHGHDPVAKARALKRLERLAPTRRRERLRELYDLLAAEEPDGLEAAIDAYVKEFGEDADAAYCRGKAAEAAGDTKAAVKHFTRALDLDGSHLAAAEALDSRLRRTALQQSKNSVQAAREVYEIYSVLLAKAPRNPYVRNNVAFALREGWLLHQADPRWREILLLSARCYEEAARIVGRRRADDKTPWATRYAHAQMVNDAGLIFHLYEPIRDPARAERYLVRALEWVDYAYLDAWTYLKQVYEAQDRWQDIHDLAVRCAANLANEAGDPLEAPREAARKVAALLVTEGKATP